MHKLFALATQITNHTPHGGGVVIPVISEK